MKVMMLVCISLSLTIYGVAAAFSAAEVSSCGPTGCSPTITGSPTIDLDPNVAGQLIGTCDVDAKCTGTTGAQCKISVTFQYQKLTGPGVWSDIGTVGCKDSESTCPNVTFGIADQDTSAGVTNPASGSQYRCTMTVYAGSCNDLHMGTATELWNGTTSYVAP